MATFPNAERFELLQQSKMDPVSKTSLHPHVLFTSSNYSLAVPLDFGDINTLSSRVLPVIIPIVK